MEQIIDKKAISVAIVDNKAYWVKDSVFYVAPITEEGMIDTDNAKPIDVFSISKKQTKALMQILDSLKED